MRINPEDTGLQGFFLGYVNNPVVDPLTALWSDL